MSQSLLQELRNFGEHSNWNSLQYLGTQRVEHPVNILYMDHDPETCAHYHADTHLGTMLVAVAQMLSTAWFMHNPECLDSYWDVNTETLPEDHPKLSTTLFGGRIYCAIAHQHPCAVWVRECRGNYCWTQHLGAALCREYEKLTKHTHPVEVMLLSTLVHTPPALMGTPTEHSEPPACVPEDCVVFVDGFVDCIASYRQHYASAFAATPFTRRPAPRWLAAAM